MGKQSGNQGSKGSKSQKNPIVNRAIAKSTKTPTKSQENAKSATIKASVEKVIHPKPENANLDVDSGSIRPPAVDLAFKMVKVMSVISNQVKYVQAQTPPSEPKESDDDKDEDPEEEEEERRPKSRFDTMKFRPPSPPKGSSSRSQTSKNGSKSKRDSSAQKSQKRSPSSRKSAKSSGRKRSPRRRGKKSV